METRATRRVMAVAVMVLALASLVPSTVDAGCVAVSVQSASSSGSVVNVVVQNTSIIPFVGYVRVSAMIGETPILSSAPVVLLPGQSATVGVGFGNSVGQVLSVGLNDNPNPF